MTARPGDPVRDVLIVGGGIVGICTALSLAGRGVRVQLIERSAPGQGASHGNAGIISPWSIVPQSMPNLWRKLPGMVLRRDGPVSVGLPHLPRFLPWAVQFMRQSTQTRINEVSAAMQVLTADCIDLYRHHLDGTGHEALIQDSFYVHAYRNAADARLDRPEYALRRRAGAELARIGAQELRALEPALSREFEAAIVIKGQARALSPGKIGQFLCEKAGKMGVTVTQAEVRALTQAPCGGWLVSTTNGTFHSPKVVMAAGAWSARLLKPLGIHLPLEAERGYHIEFPKPAVTLNHSVMDVDGRFAASSINGGLRVAGTAEFAGLDTAPDMKRAEGLGRLARKMLPDLHTDNPITWSGIRPSFPDSLPVLGTFARHPGLFGAFGHAHYGLMMAPKTGELMADLICDRPHNISIAAYSAERFAR